VHKSNPLHAAVNAHSNNSSKNRSTASSRESHRHYAGLGHGHGHGYGGGEGAGPGSAVTMTTAMTSEELALAKQAYDKVLDIERLSKQGQGFYRSGDPDKAIGSFSKASVVCESLALMHAKGGR
jgi:hypothetical protein